MIPDQMGVTPEVDPRTEDDGFYTLHCTGAMPMVRGEDVEDAAALDAALAEDDGARISLDDYLASIKDEESIPYREFRARLENGTDCD